MCYNINMYDRWCFMKSKKGFTLVELLVVIALMLTILGIAIVSFINVSNNKKQEAWEQVKKQIEAGALEYFNANEYLFEGLSSESFGNITVGKLVEEDYLNKVTDPRDGKAVDECSYVKVTRGNNGYKASYTTEVLNEEICNNNNDSIIIITELGAPSLSPVINCTKGNSNWCVSDAKIDLNISTNNNGKITEVSKTEENNSLCSLSDDKNTLDCNKEGSTTINVVVTNASGKTAKWIGGVKIDKTAPTIDLHYDNYSANCTSFKNLDGNHVQYKNTVGITDNLSGIASTDYDYKYDGDWLNEEFGRDTKNRARANTAVLQRNGTALKYIYQSYNFLKNKDSTFKIKACDNAGNCTGYQQKKYSAKSSSNFESYCRSKFPTTNPTLRSNYTEKCSSNTSINCWLTADQ